MLEEEQQKEAQNNQQQQQIHSQVILPSTITATSHQNQIPNISHRNNLFGQKMTPWKLLSSLLSIE